MEISGVPFRTFHAIVDNISRDRYNGNITVHQDAKDLHGARKPRMRGRLTVISSREAGARRSWTGRRMPAACWHAYRDVLAEMFQRFPDATVRTSMATYKGKAGFLAQYPGTAHRNVGSAISPAYMPDLCDCADDGADVDSNSTTSEILAQADRVLALAQAQTPSDWLLAAFDNGVEPYDYARMM